MDQETQRDVEQLHGPLSRLADGHRLAALERAGLLDGTFDHTLAELTRLASETLGVPVALVSLVTESRQVFVGAHGLGEPWATRAGTGLSHSFCRLVIDTDAPLIVTDARADPRVADNLAIPDLGVLAYAGTPLRDPDGAVLGSVCAIDTQPRVWTDTELGVIERINGILTALVADRMRMHQPRPEAATTDQLARRLQRALLPTSLDHGSGRVVSAYQPGSQRLLLGGDFADVHWHANGDLGFVLGDICGHGPESAAMAIGIRSSWAALEGQCPDLEELIGHLNDIGLREQRGDGGMFTSLVIGRISADGTNSRALNAGHQPPIDLARNVSVDLPPGPVIGIFENATWQSGELPELPGGLLLYTDGLIEGYAAPGSRERWGEEALLDTIAAELGAGRIWPELPLRLIRAATAANGDELPDDVAILIIR